MPYSAFSRCHPAVNFFYFLLVICFSVTVTHPAYTITGILCGGVYYCILKGRDGWKLIRGMIPLFLLITFLNPLVSTHGITPLFYVFGRKYTLEALCYGASLGGMFLLMMIWFGCYSVVLTSDKFTYLFGNLIPAVSLLLVMILRLIPAFTRKTKQILEARSAIGKGSGQADSLKDKLHSGMMVLSSLTDWALEGSIITADSMRSRGYGLGKRTSFRRYRMRKQDVVLLILMLLLAMATLFAGGTGAKYSPRISVENLTWGLGAYCCLLLIPIILTGKEILQWNNYLSEI